MNIAVMTYPDFFQSLNQSPAQQRLLEAANTDVLDLGDVLPANQADQALKGEAEGEVEISTEILIMLFLLMLAITGGHFLHKSGHKYLQEAGLTTLIGIVAGYLLGAFGVGEYLTSISNHFGNLFLILLLPPIIFEGGYNMAKKPFLRNLGTIIAYSFGGTFIAIFSTSAMFYFMGETNASPAFTWKESFAFGSLISATDPVSVLAIFKMLNADEDLNAIIFGESIFNDAIAIVMYSTVMSVGDTGLSAGAQTAQAIGRFVLIFVGSLFIGAVTALLIAFVLKRQASYLKEDSELNQNQEKNERQINERAKQKVNNEIAFMLLCPWVCYLIAEGLELSGIVAILMNGVFLNYYATPNISPAAKKVLKMGYETFAYATETMVFIFLGIGLFAFDHPYSEMGWGLPLTTIINLNIARALNIGIITALVNCSRTKTKINYKTQFVMWISGLRGAMAYALALKAAVELPSVGGYILIDTLLYSYITVLIIGSILNPLLSKLGVKQKPKEETELVEVVEEQNNCFNRLKKRFRHFDSQYFSPLFIKDLRSIQRRNLVDPGAELDTGNILGALNQPEDIKPRDLGAGFEPN